MKAVWAGLLSFGLINIPIKLYSPVRESPVIFKLLHKKDMQPIRHARICEAERKEVPFNEIVRGYEYELGKYVILEKEDFEKANAKKFKTIDIFQFSEKKEADPKYFASFFYLVPAKEAEKVYILLRDALRTSGKLGIGKAVIRNKEYLVALEESNNDLILNRLYYEQNLSPPPDLEMPVEADYSEEEINITSMIIEKLTKPLNVSSHRDTYLDDLKKIIRDKIEGKGFRRKPITPKKTPVSNLLEFLKKSLDNLK